MHILKYIVITLLACCLVACSCQNDKCYYKNSKTIPRMVTPKGLSSAKIKDKYSISNTKTNKTYRSVSLIPPGTGTLP